MCDWFVLGSAAPVDHMLAPVPARLQAAGEAARAAGPGTVTRATAAWQGQRRTAAELDERQAQRAAVSAHDSNVAGPSYAAVRQAAPSKYFGAMSVQPRAVPQWRQGL